MKKTGWFVVLFLMLFSFPCMAAEEPDWKAIVEKNRAEDNKIEKSYVSNLPALNITYNQFFENFNNLSGKEKQPYKIKMDKLSKNGHNEAVITKDICLSLRTNTKTKRIEFIGITSKMMSEKEIKSTIRVMNLLIGTIDPKLSRSDRKNTSERLSLDNYKGIIRPIRAEEINNTSYVFSSAVSGNIITCWFNITPGQENE